MRCTSVLLLLVALSAGEFSAAGTSPSHLLLISLDGARPDIIQQAATPHLQALAARGAFTWSAQTVFPPATLPAHASLLSGLSPVQHRYDDNVVRPCGAFEFPTLLSLADAAGYHTAMVAGKGPLCQFHIDDDTAYHLATAGDRSVTDEAVALLEVGYEFVMAHYPNPDYFGHAVGWESETYYRELRNTDYEVGRLLAAVEQLGLTDRTLVVLTADHGGHGRVHGQRIPEDMTIPWIMAGPGVRANFDLADTRVQLIDTAPTVLHMLGISVPGGLSGRIVCEALIAGCPP